MLKEDQRFHCHWFILVFDSHNEAQSSSEVQDQTHGCSALLRPSCKGHRVFSDSTAVVNDIRTASISEINKVFLWLLYRNVLVLLFFLFWIMVIFYTGMLVFHQ